MSLWQDVRHALRQIARRPGQPIVIVLSLACALGINSALFAFINGIWLAPWPVARADRLRVVQPAVSIDTWRAWRAQDGAFEDLAALSSGPLLRLSGRLLHLDFVSANYLDMLGAEIVLGRGFADREAAPDGAVISHQLWRRHFGGDPRVVGRTFTLDLPGRRRPTVADGASAGLTLRVIGVASPGFDGVHQLRTQLWLPLTALPRLESATSRVMVFGRLSSGITDDHAAAELAGIRSPSTTGSDSPPPIELRTTDLDSQSPQPLQTRVMIGSLVLGIVFITLVACANVSNLLLARGHARRGEIALRLALGAPRGHLVRLLLLECFLFTLLASLIGLGVATSLPDLLLQRLLRDSSLGLAELLRFSFPLDGRVFGWTLAMAVVACLSFGLAPARRSTNLRPEAVLKSAQGQAGAVLLTRLVSWQTIVSVMALAIGGFLVRSTGVGVAPAATLGGRAAATTHDATLATAQLTMAFGGIALALGAVGLFSVLEFAVRLRTRDIGIRRALGAEARHIIAAVGLPAARAMLRGLAIGSAGAAIAGAFMARADLPAGVRPLDPVTYVGVAAIVTIAGLLAASVPLRRALRIAPADALRRD